MPAGRPTKYDPAYCDQVEKLCKLGATDEEIADFFEVAVTTIDNWKNDYPEFLGAIKKGKQIADAEVADKLFKRATGYSHEAVKIFNDEGTPLIVDYTEHYPPDTTAAIFWLKNRQRGKWSDRTITQMEGNPDAPINFTLDERFRDQSNTPVPKDSMGL